MRVRGETVLPRILAEALLFLLQDQLCRRKEQTLWIIVFSSAESIGGLEGIDEAVDNPRLALEQLFADHEGVRDREDSGSCKILLDRRPARLEEAPDPRIAGTEAIRDIGGDQGVH